MSLDDAKLYQDPLRPFTVWDTCLCVLVLWPVAILQMILWLALFMLLHKTFLPGERIDGLARFASRCVTFFLGIRVRRRSLEKLERGRSYVFCMNHVSLLDTPVLVQAIPFHCRSFQDVAHMRIPLYGRFVRLMGQLPVDPQDKALNERSFARALAMLRDGKSFAVFPEGHRSRDGRLGTFYPGAFRLAIEAGVPLVPVCTRGLRALCPAKEWRIRPGRVEVLFGDPIPPAGGDIDTLSRRTREAMNALLLDGGH